MKNPISQGKVVLMLLVGCLEIFSLIPPCSRPPRIPLNSTKKYHQHAPTTVVMRLITHNMLKSNVKGVINGFPLRIEAEKVEVKETEFNSEFVQNLLPKVDWPALRGASKELGMDELPEEMDEANKTDDSFLQLVHKLLLDVHVLEGSLVCPETGRRFPINNGIPNMLLHEDEVA
ncbi:TRM112-like protein [Nannochloropsis gaditana]|uniref:TRM112-like protein n=1 Tax=Nannochloropsis gaditana TaxID=72520 RepID=W7TQC2_9STRA|nr:TRM112-like protein [Nannochloropsis gaditana]